MRLLWYGCKIYSVSSFNPRERATGDWVVCNNHRGTDLRQTDYRIFAALNTCLTLLKPFSSSWKVSVRHLPPVDVLAVMYQIPSEN